MTPLVCPHCGGELKAEVVLDSAHLGADWRDPPAQTGAEWRSLAQSGADAHVVLDLDLDSLSTNDKKPKVQDYPYDFEVFWKVYPMRKGKRKALKAWRSALARLAQTGASLPERAALLVAGARRYAEYVEREGIERVKYAEGWLNDDRWEDEPAPERSPRVPDRAGELMQRALETRRLERGDRGSE